MKIFFAAEQLLHDPKQEFAAGGFRPAMEVPETRTGGPVAIVREGFRVPPCSILEGGAFDFSSISLLHSHAFPTANPNGPAVPQYPNHLQVTIDIRYQYAIMVSLSRHCPFVPSEPCAPATASF